MDGGPDTKLGVRVTDVEPRWEFGWGGIRHTFPAHAVMSLFADLASLLVGLTVLLTAVAAMLRAAAAALESAVRVTQAARRLRDEFRDAQAGAQNNIAEQDSYGAVIGANRRDSLVRVGDPIAREPQERSGTIRRNEGTWG